MSSPGAGDDHVDRRKRTARAIALDDGDLGPGSKRLASPFRDPFVDFDSDDSPLRSNQFGKNC